MASISGLLRDEVYEAIKKDILAGRLAPGEKVHEAQLAEHYKTSKTPVREALNRLVQEDLVVVFPRMGYVVAPVTLEDAQSVLDFRAILETAGIELAARYATEAELAQITAMADLDVRPGDRDSYGDFFAQNRLFHLTVAGASRNPHLVDAIARLFDKIDRLLRYRLELDGSSCQRMRDEHRAVADALLARDPAAARQSLLLGLNQTTQEVLTALISDPAGRAQNGAAPLGGPPQTEPRSIRSGAGRA